MELLWTTSQEEVRINVDLTGVERRKGQTCGPPKAPEGHDTKTLAGLANSDRLFSFSTRREKQ